MQLIKLKLGLKKSILIGILALFHSITWGIEVSIEGVDNSDLQDNIKLYLTGVNAPVSEYDIDDYSKKVIASAQKAVEAFGYYNAAILLSPVVYDAQNVNLKLNVTLNKLTKVDRVVISSDIDAILNATTSPTNKPNSKQVSDSNIPEKLLGILTQLKGMQNKPLNHSQYDSLKSQLSSFAVLYGYFDFRFLIHKLIITPSGEADYSSATIHWIFNLGERYRFGDLEFIQDTRGQGLANQVKPFKTGEFFDQTKVGKFSIGLASTGYFDSAIARANAEKAEDLLVPIEVILKPKPKDLYKFGVGFSTDTKARVSVDWERPWVNLDGHSAGANLYLSNPRKSFSVDYRIPKANPLNDFLSYRASIKQTEENDTLSDAVSFEVLRQWGAEDEQGWDKIGFLKAEQESFIQGVQDRQSTRLIMPGITLSRTRRKGDVFVNWGDRQQITVQAASKSLLSDIDFVKVLAKTKWIREFGIHRITARADAGAISTNDFSRVPSSQRFFAGGDQSIRGFGFNEVSQIEQVEVDGVLEDELIGGKYLAVASLEYAFKVADNWRAATFIDIGSANDKFGSDLVTGVGIGFHWLSPIGNVQFYIARGRSSTDVNGEFHIIIGPGL